MDRYMIGLWPSSKKRTKAESGTVTVPSSRSDFFFLPPPPLRQKEGAIPKVSCRASALPLDQFGNKPKTAT